MKSNRFCGALGCAAVLFSLPAMAQWVHMAGEDDPFAGGSQQFAGGVAETGEMVMFRCTSDNDLALLYVSIERPPDEAEIMRVLAAAKAELLVIVDEDPVVALPAIIDMTPDRERLRYVSEHPAVEKLATRAAAAKRRVAVAVQIGGKRIYSTAINARGSGKAMGKLTKACKLGD